MKAASSANLAHVGAVFDPSWIHRRASLEECEDVLRAVSQEGYVSQPYLGYVGEMPEPSRAVLDQYLNYLRFMQRSLEAMEAMLGLL